MHRKNTYKFPYHQIFRNLLRNDFWIKYGNVQNNACVCRVVILGLDKFCRIKSAWIRGNSCKGQVGNRSTCAVWSDVIARFNCVRVSVQQCLLLMKCLWAPSCLLVMRCLWAPSCLLVMSACEPRTCATQPRKYRFRLECKFDLYFKKGVRAG